MNTHSQSEQNQTDPLTIDFSHRLSPLSGVNFCTLSDSVNMMANRAEAILQMLALQFIDDDQDKLNDELICGAIDAAIKEIEDIKQVVQAYHEANKKGDVQ